MSKSHVFYLTFGGVLVFLGVALLRNGVDEVTTNNIYPIKNNGSQRTALDDYVYSKESLKHFSWYHAKEFDFRRTNVITNVSYDAYVLNMTSGKWLNGELFYFSPHLHIKSDRFN